VPGLASAGLDAADPDLGTWAMGRWPSRSRSALGAVLLARLRERFGRHLFDHEVGRDAPLLDGSRSRSGSPAGGAYPLALDREAPASTRAQAPRGQGR